MSLAKTYSAQIYFLSAVIIDVEVDLSKGLHSFSIVGLANKSVNEARDRVGAAIKNCGWKSPKNKNQKVVVSLAPANVAKQGSVFDLAIAVCYLIASGDIRVDTTKRMFIGELSLDGTLRPVTGILPIVQKAKAEGFTEIFLPEENAEEAGIISGITILPAKNLKEVVSHINTKEPQTKISPQGFTLRSHLEREIDCDFSDIAGQESAKRALQIAASGGHNICLYGPPGTGKTMLAKAAAYLLPPLSLEETIEVTSIYSATGQNRHSLIEYPPFRSPHHTASHIAMIGGGSQLKAGEITLAHKGILFLDEFPEFDQKVLESLRQPLEDRVIAISRAKGGVLFPAGFMLVAAMNPCPCGNRGIRGKTCVCSAISIERYKRKLSGPIIDRIDLWAEVGDVQIEKLSLKNNSGSEKIISAVASAREIQQKRQGKINAELKPKDLLIGPDIRNFLNQSAKELDLSARSYHRIVKIARTIADLEQSEQIHESHILEALQYRPKKYQIRA